MWILIMIVALSGQGKAVTMSHQYYEDKVTCVEAAKEFEAAKRGDLVMRSFCIRGDQ